jgi:hypothetical protein
LPQGRNQHAISPDAGFRMHHSFPRPFGRFLIIVA